MRKSCLKHRGRKWQSTSGEKEAAAPTGLPDARTEYCSSPCREVFLFLTGSDLLPKPFGTMPPQRVCIFGLSANPPTGTYGHQGIVSKLCDTNEYDEIWIMPVFLHAFAHKRNLAPFDDRCEMSRLAFEKLSTDACGVRVKTTERTVYNLSAGPDAPEPSTAEVLSYLVNRHQNTAFAMALGGDTFLDLVDGRWCCREADIAQMTTQFEVFVRGDRIAILDALERTIDANAFPIPPVSLHDMPPPLDGYTVSSTEARQQILELSCRCSKTLCVETDAKNWPPELIDPEVLLYVRERGLYQNTVNDARGNGDEDFFQDDRALKHPRAPPGGGFSSFILSVLAIIFTCLVALPRWWFRAFHRWPRRLSWFF